MKPKPNRPIRVLEGYKKGRRQTFVCSEANAGIHKFISKDSMTKFDLMELSAGTFTRDGKQIIGSFTANAKRVDHMVLSGF